MWPGWRARPAPASRCGRPAAHGRSAARRRSPAIGRVEPRHAARGSRLSRACRCAAPMRHARRAGRRCRRATAGRRSLPTGPRSTMPPGIHDGDVVGHFGDHAEIVRDQQHGGADLALQLHDQHQDLRLHRHVERGGRLVGDQEPRAAGERHRDHDALAHAARQLVRIGTRAAGAHRGCARAPAAPAPAAAPPRASIALDAGGSPR